MSKTGPLVVGRSRVFEIEVEKEKSKRRWAWALRRSRFSMERTTWNEMKGMQPAT